MPWPFIMLMLYVKHTELAYITCMHIACNIRHARLVLLRCQASSGATLICELHGQGLYGMQGMMMDDQSVKVQRPDEATMVA